MARAFISEDDIEQAVLEKLNTEFHFELLNCFTVNREELNDKSNRKDKRDVVLVDRLQAACTRLNPEIPENVIEQVVDKITDRRNTMSPMAANREIYEHIRDGMQMEFEDAQGVKQEENVRLIDFENPESNQYLAVSQLWIKSLGQAPLASYRRPDIILYVNGLPLVFIELKNSSVKLQTAYDENLINYKHDIPQLFHCNAVCILSNAVQTKVGSFSAGWEHFFHWFRADDEKQKVDRKKISEDGTSLEYALAGLCRPTRLLDYVENFILFHKENTKIIAQNHQFLGVNNAYGLFLRRKELEGKLGVFWHTQGSGKSYSMIFYVRKIRHKLRGNFSFVVVTDRKDLNGQIYKNFVDMGAVSEDAAAQPGNAKQLRESLGENKRVLFTLIQKFRFDKGKEYPHLFNPEEREIVVLVDEAHRTQYEDLAENMRAGLKGAHFIAFTGTPLLGKGRKTHKWFGDYVSEYNFQQAMDDGATVPLYYEKRVPEVWNHNDDLSEEFYQILEDEEVDATRQEKLERKFAREMEVVKRDERLEIVAQDIIYHFPRRGYLGKGMVVCIDKFTAVKMYDKVQRLKKDELKKLRGRINESRDEIEIARFKKIIEYLRKIEMAVVISDPAADKKKFEAAGLNIEPHIKRLEELDENSQDIEANFKDPEHPLQLVFVCAMWLTGFDAPTLSTLYLDKPMKDHSLMQAIARANRVSPFRIKGHGGKLVEKTNGEIIDYFNVFRNMKKALKDYAQGDGDSERAPVQEKISLFSLLEQALEQIIVYCKRYDIDLKAVAEQEAIFKNISKLEEYANILLSQDAWRKEFNVYENAVSSLYEACKPEIFQNNVRLVAVVQYLRGLMDSIVDQTEIDEVVRRISELLDESVVVNDAEGFPVKEHGSKYRIVQRGKAWDLSTIDFDQLREDFPDTEYKNIEIADMRAFLNKKLRTMIEQNSTRRDFAEKFQEIIDRYNSGGSSNENYFNELVDFAQSMKEEDERHVREGLSEDELELYDILKKEKLTKAEEQKVKLAAKHLILRLLDAHPKVLVQDWWKDSQSLLNVQAAIAEVLDEDLPEIYDQASFDKKRDRVLRLVVDQAVSGNRWVM